jgi:serine/threonine protein kinase
MNVDSIDYLPLTSINTTLFNNGSSQVNRKKSTRRSSPLNAINTTLFNKQHNIKSELLDNSSITFLSKYDVELSHLVQSNKRHGSGAFGYVTSAEVECKFSSQKRMTNLKGYTTKRLVTAMKVSKPTFREGVNNDVVKECATYARIMDSDNLAKGVFAKLTTTSQNLVLEHYSINLHDVFVKMTIPWNVRDELIRCVFFQVVTGLNELHERGFIHKDLKAKNILLSHDGRILIADFGLTTYLVNGSDTPQDFYFRSTTDNIEPPEGNVLDRPIGKSYDIWSLGCFLAYTIQKGMIDYEFYTSGDDWRETVTLKDYNTVTREILNYIYDNLAKRPEKPSDTFLKSAKELLINMLVTDPGKRPTAKRILKHSWFDGLTLNKAIATVREILGPNPALGNIWKSSVIRNTRKIRNENTHTQLHRDKEVASYFQIAKQPLVSRFLNPELHKDIVFILKLFVTYVHSMVGSHYFYGYLHALELFNRIVLKDHSLNNKTQLLICINLSLKLAANDNFSAIGFHKIKHDMTIKQIDEYMKAEENIIRMLNGDTYPQVGGLVDKVVEKIGNNDNKISVARKILTNIFAGSATFDEYVNVDGVQEYEPKLSSLFALLKWFPEV